MEFTALKGQVKALQGKNEFAEAREMLERAKEGLDEQSPEFLWIQQQRALCTYKDTYRQPEERHKSALEILKSIGLYDPETKDKETLGIGGAVYKRMWEHDGNEAHLRAASELYQAGWQRDRENDQGYCGVNAAYLLDLSAHLVERTAQTVGGGKDAANALRLQAQQLREDMLASIPQPGAEEKDYWLFVTLAEIHFGLDQFEQAAGYLARARDIEGLTCKFETTAKQLIQLACWRGYIVASVRGINFADKKKKTLACRAALKALLGDNLDAALGRLRGKVGLALSGGGFRAAFYHLGVLARLAEIDALRHVEVLSTVSGGSIVGVHYYLELKKLLERRPDAEITRDDYIKIVRRVQRQFRKGVQENLRMRILSDFKKNLQMIFKKGYSRSQRIGELYEEKLYAQVADDVPPEGERTMPSLLIRPPEFETAEDFKPRDRNWLRGAKVPELVVNTTSLNSGHNFQFTASWMGEPPGLIGAEVDMNLRYRRLYYREAKKTQYQKFRLGYAVAASSCVPGLFDPLEIDELYPGRAVRLVDGGVHDNQGVAGLLDEGCDFIFCSDASGQMHDQENPSSNFLGVPLRSNDILQDRIRECQYEHLRAMSLSGRLKGLFFIHLKKDIAQEDIAWIGGAEKIPNSQRNQTPYGIDRDLQRQLAEIRTDLDSFSQVEAYALMLSGYRMAEEHAKALNREFKDSDEMGAWGGFDVDAPSRRWPFLRLEPIAAKPGDSSDLRREDLEKQLAAGKKLMFKAWRLSPRLKVAGILLIALTIFVVGGLLWAFSDTTFSIGGITSGLVIAGLLLLVPLAWPARLAVMPGRVLRESLVKLGLAVFGWVVAQTHLKIFDPVFLNRGRILRLLRLPSND
ncbi:MAG: patatin-like phospholipase family protein [Desulfuromonadaceae bacterium]